MNEQTKTMTQETQNREEFIMLPTVDFCFKELMQNAKVRQGTVPDIFSHSALFDCIFWGKKVKY